MTTTLSAYATTFHRNGDVTYWSVYAQQWVRMPATDVHDEILATLPDRDRGRIARIVERSRRDA